MYWWKCRCGCIAKKNSYLSSLSALSVPQLNAVVASLHLASQRRKIDLLEIVLDDFLEQRLNLWDIVRSSTSPCAVSISQFFYTRYGDSVFRAFSDLRSVNDFRTDASVCASHISSGIPICTQDITMLSSKHVITGPPKKIINTHRVIVKTFYSSDHLNQKNR